jgi:hypothetical protein
MTVSSWNAKRAKKIAVIENLLNRVLSKADRLSSLNDQEASDLLLKLTMNARERRQPMVKVPTETAYELHLLLQSHIPLKRGRQEKSPRAWHVEEALRVRAKYRKAELIDSGIAAGIAEEQAADEAVARGREYGINLAVSTFRRRMQSTGK